MRATEISAPLEFCGQSFFWSNDLNDHRQKTFTDKSYLKKVAFSERDICKIRKELKSCQKLFIEWS